MKRRASARLGRFLILAAAVAGVGLPASAQQADSALVRLLKGGRVPPERQGTIVEMIGKRGTAADLGYLYERTLQPDGFAPEIRLKALDALATAAATRATRPETEPAGLAALIEPKADPAVLRAALRLAAIWKIEALAPRLTELASAPATPDPIRSGALEALGAIGGTEATWSITGLAGGGRPTRVRVAAVAALAALDIDAAASQAGDVIRTAREGDDLGPLMAAFLNRQEGPGKLAAAIAQPALPADAAKLALRAMYAQGRAEPELVAELSKAAGLDAEVQPFDTPAMERFAAEVASQGDPARGERIFRRADLNCTKCHALSGAGGGIGPELSALGGSSPVDYIVNAILAPDQAIKEEYHTLVVLTAEGQIYQGIVVDRDDQRLVLKEATGEQRVVPAESIEESKEGGSLMPKGLSNLMTRAEFVDLVRFLSELGKPGPYGIRSTPTIQRWRVLSDVPEAFITSVPDPEHLRGEVLEAAPARWRPFYAKVAGALPLDELTAATHQPVIYLQGEVEVSTGGPVEFRLDDASGVRAWLDGAPVADASTMSVRLEPGRHALTLRVDTAARSKPELTVEVAKPVGAATQYTVVGGL